MELLSHSLQESQFIILSPFWQIFKFTGPHAVVLNISFHDWLSTEFLVNLSAKQPFAWDVRHLLTTVLPWWHWWGHTVGCVTVWAHSCHRPSHDTGETVVIGYTSDRQGKAEKKDVCTDGGLYVNSTCQQQIRSCHCLVRTPKNLYTFNTRGTCRHHLC